MSRARLTPSTPRVPLIIADTYQPIIAIVWYWPECEALCWSAVVTYMDIDSDIYPALVLVYGQYTALSSQIRRCALYTELWAIQGIYWWLPGIVYDVQAMLESRNSRFCFTMQYDKLPQSRVALKAEAEPDTRWSPLSVAGNHTTQGWNQNPRLYIAHCHYSIYSADAAAGCFRAAVKDWNLWTQLEIFKQDCICWDWQTHRDPSTSLMNPIYGPNKTWNWKLGGHQVALPRIPEVSCQCLDPWKLLDNICKWLNCRGMRTKWRWLRLLITQNRNVSALGDPRRSLGYPPPVNSV